MASGAAGEPADAEVNPKADASKPAPTKNGARRCTTTDGL
jgi:hypothetical protein